MRVCTSCEFAALDSGGVWCKAFAESILDEAIAEDCGHYEEAQVPLVYSTNEPPKADIVSLNSQRKGECGRQISFRVDLDFYGKLDQVAGIRESFERKVYLHFGDLAKVAML